MFPPVSWKPFFILILSTAYSFYEYKQYASLATEANSLGSIKWESSVTRTTSLLKSVNFDDAFNIIPVPQDLLSDFNYLVGVIPVLDEFIRKYHGKPIQRMTPDEYHVEPPPLSSLSFSSPFSQPPLFFQFISTALFSLKSFLNEGGEIQRSKQDLLRTTRVVEMLIKVLQVPFKSPPGFESVPGFNHQGLSMDDIKDFPPLSLPAGTPTTSLPTYFLLLPPPLLLLV